jgi:hypothetical protein
VDLYTYAGMMSKNFPMKEDGSAPDWKKVREKYGRGATPETLRLPYKYKRAIVRQEREKLTNQQAADEVGVTLGTYKQYRHCKQGKALIKAAREHINDPHQFVKYHLDDVIPEQFVALLQDIDIMERMGDHINSAKNRVKLLEMAGFFDKNQFNVNVDAQNIQITISSSDGDGYIRKALQEGPQPVPEAEYTIVDDKDRSSTTT